MSLDLVGFKLLSLPTDEMSYHHHQVSWRVSPWKQDKRSGTPPIYMYSYTISHLESWIQQNAKYANLFLYLWTSRFTNLLFSNSDQYLLSRIMSKRDMDILARDMANASKWFWYPTCWCSNAIDASIFGLALASRSTKQTKMPHQAELPGCLLAIDVFFVQKTHHGSLMIRHQALPLEEFSRPNSPCKKFKERQLRDVGQLFSRFLARQRKAKSSFFWSRWIWSRES